MYARHQAVFAAALAFACAGGVHGQEIAQQVKQTRNGTVRLIFASKPGTCGDGATFISTGIDEEGRHSRFHQTRGGWNTTTGAGGYDPTRCEAGPVRVDLTVNNGVVTDLETYVGARWPQPANVVGTRAAVDYLLSLAEKSAASAGKHAILPALLADSVEPWPQLLRIAKNENAAREVRKSAIFWLGQAAGDKATEGLKSLLTDADLEVKKQAVFAISQLRGEQSVSALIEIVRTSKDKEIRKNALFWLSQKNDPRVIALLEEILLER
jgi:hypothetical protein